ncbi:MAG: DinB family protein [Lewinellaceae bacterium]|nr:DinB family protein [Lewinellaceae bacterium]
MGQAKPLADRFREVILTGRWIANTNFQDQLAEVTWEQAIQQVGTFNTLAALTFHVNYYIAGILNVFKGGSLDIRDKYSFDLPPIQSPEDWETLRTALWDNAAQFAQYVERLSDEQLADVFVEEKYGTYLRNIEGMIEHSYYHLGQVVLLKKMLQPEKLNG